MPERSGSPLSIASARTLQSVGPQTVLWTRAFRKETDGGPSSFLHLWPPPLNPLIHLPRVIHTRPPLCGHPVTLRGRRHHPAVPKSFLTTVLLTAGNSLGQRALGLDPVHSVGTFPGTQHQPCLGIRPTRLFQAWECTGTLCSAATSAGQGHTQAMRRSARDFRFSKGRSKQISSSSFCSDKIFPDP